MTDITYKSVQRILEGIHRANIERHAEFARWDTLAREKRTEEIPEEMQGRRGILDSIRPRQYFEAKYRQAA
jgi:hypothetical protein